ncbi:hypothetical protein BDV96DRAFT_601322 [Lophiotrema nucula]|uniref:Uncharacterized protein n=1 Tax=Lophiotrema nucula TaxID=690887 RepID=A0A6A5Z4N2_9PLEO|nr:hypothetical protein BDV96DRAFT_601322 [Lophiotrema nucula]
MRTVVLSKPFIRTRTYALMLKWYNKRIVRRIHSMYQLYRLSGHHSTTLITTWSEGHCPITTWTLRGAVSQVLCISSLVTLLLAPGIKRILPSQPQTASHNASPTHTQYHPSSLPSTSRPAPTLLQHIPVFANTMPEPEDITHLLTSVNPPPSTTRSRIIHNRIYTKLSKRITILLAAMQDLDSWHIEPSDWAALREYHTTCTHLSELFDDFKLANEAAGLKLNEILTGRVNKNAKYGLNDEWIVVEGYDAGETGRKANARVRQRTENEDGFVVIDVLAQPRMDPPRRRW